MSARACGHTPLAMPLERLLAHPHNELDALDDGRDEGEERLKRVRAVVQALRARARPALLDPVAPDSLVALLAPAHPAARAALQHSLLAPASTQKPRTRLVAPLGKLMRAEAVDLMPEKQRAECCVAVRGTPRVCVFGMPTNMLPAPRVVVEFDRALAGGSVAAGTRATLTLVRTGREALEATAFAANGQATTLRADGLDARLLDRLVERFKPPAEHGQLVPRQPGDLPGGVAAEVAAFLQEHLRAHVLPAALAPEGRARPLAFEQVSFKHEGPPGRKRAVVRALLHPTSARCACALHGALPIEARAENATERFVASQVEFTLAMCGRALGVRDDGGRGPCPVHGYDQPNVPQLRAVCCHGTHVSIGCAHKTLERSFKLGLNLHNVPLSAPNLLHARVLVAAAARCHEATSELIGAGKPDELIGACERARLQLTRKLEAVDAERVKLPDDEYFSPVALRRNDEAATELLREGAVHQHRAADGALSLQVEHEGRKAKLAGNLASLAKTHLHLFPPPPRGAKRRR